MLKQIWQWLKGLFQRLFGGGTSQSSASRKRSLVASSSSSAEMPKTEAPPPLSDSDYEYLFMQLVEGVAHGWNQQRVARWFEGFKGRTTEADWVAWLQRFGARVLASPAPNEELGMRMVYLGEQALATPSLQQIGNMSYEIGRQLLSRNPSASGVVWEYEGPDEPSAPSSPDLAAATQPGEPINPDNPGVETLTLDELLVRLQQDPELLKLISQQLGIETNDPNAIILALLNQFNATNQSAGDETS
jgi:hypothetical protein